MNKEGQPNHESELEIKRYGYDTLLFMKEDSYVGGQVLCSDGQVRRLMKISPHPQTSFETTGVLSIEGKAVVGSIIFETIDGEMPNKHNPIIVKFSARGKNAQNLPKGVYRKEKEL